MGCPLCYVSSLGFELWLMSKTAKDDTFSLHLCDYLSTIWQVISLPFSRDFTFIFVGGDQQCVLHLAFISLFSNGS